jgi:hypothetical protein
MAIVSRKPSSELAPVPAPSPGLDGYVVLEVDEWLEARPPATSRIGEHWATIITPTRHLARGWLFVTYTWARFAVLTLVLLTVAGIVLLRIWS